MIPNRKKSFILNREEYQVFITREENMKGLSPIQKLLSKKAR